MAASGSMHTGTRLLIVALGFSCLAPVPANILAQVPHPMLVVDSLYGKEIICGEASMISSEIVAMHKFIFLPLLW